MPLLITRMKLWRVPLALLIALMIGIGASAQGATVLAPGTTLGDALGADGAAVSYVFDAPAGSQASLTVESASRLALLLADFDGNAVARASDSAGVGSAALVDANLTSGGRYFVVVYLAPGEVPSAANFDIGFSLSSGQVAAAAVAPSETPSQVLIAAGIETRLSWTGAADLNLQVRDPSGQTLYWDSRTTPNGGIFGFDANGLCEVLSDAPVETATWQPGFLPTGSYEVLVFYREACDSSVGSLPFALQISADGDAPEPINAVLSPPQPGQDSVYIARFEIGADGSANLNTGGLYPSARLTAPPAGFDIATDTPANISAGIPVSGAISNESPYMTWSFMGEAGDVITAEMNAVGPNLDTLLQIVDSSGAVVNFNDDAPGTTNSLISNARLLTSGVFTIIATRYGHELGGTEGAFELALDGIDAAVADELTALELPAGDIEVTLVWSTTADLQLLVRDPIGDSVFDDLPLGSSGGILAANGNVNCVPVASGAPVSYIYWPPGRMRPGSYEVEVWYQNPCSETPLPVDFTLLIEVAGKAVAVERQFPLANQRFVTNFTVNPDGSAVGGDGGFIDVGSDTVAYLPELLAAPTISLNQTVGGTIGGGNTFDLYSFQGATGETVTIRMSAGAKTLDTALYLISPGGNEIASNDDGDLALLDAGAFATDSIISSFTLPENGPYTIIATRYAGRYGGTIGSYSLTLSQG